MAAKAQKREEAKQESMRRKEEVDRRRAEQDIQRRQKEVQKRARAAEAQAKEAFRQAWTKDAIQEARERLQRLIRNPPPLPPSGSRIAPFCGYLPSICKENMARRLAKRRYQKFGTGNPIDILPATPPAWVHRGDPRYVREENAPNSHDIRTDGAAT